MHVCYHPSLDTDHGRCGRQFRTFGKLAFHSRKHMPEVNWRRIMRGFK